MKKMKKWELLKKAYETFPAGTRFTWGGYTITSSGIFNFSDDERNKGHILDSNDKVVFDGKQWAEIIEETKKEFVMMSEDGVQLCRGDNYCMVKNIPATGNVWKVCIESVPMNEISFAITDPDHCKAFSTKDAAEKWCDKQNNKHIIMSKKALFVDTEYPVIVHKDYFDVKFLPNSKMCGIRFSKEEFQQIQEAFNKLQS